MLSAVQSSVERPAGTLDEDTIRSLWALRLRNIDLRPEVDPDVDYRKFRSYFGGDARVLLIHDARSEIRGFYAFHHRVLALDGTARLVAHVEYGFVDAGHRGSLAARLGAMRAVAGILARHPLLEKVAVFVAYPTSTVAMARYARRISAPGDPGLTGWRREALEAYLREVVGSEYDAEAGLVRMRTRPTVALHVPRSERGRQALAWYEARNPRWREGYGLPLLVEGDARSFARGVADALGVASAGARTMTGIRRATRAWYAANPE